MARFFVLLVLLAPFVFAQDAAVSFVPVSVEEDRAPVQTPQFKHLAIVVDLSGSVRDRPAVAEQVQAAALALASAGSDEWALTCVAFAERPITWSHGWLPMPNGNAPRYVETFLQGCTKEVVGTSTNVSAGIELALKHRRPHMLVAVVSDGEYSFVERDQALALCAQSARGRSVPIAFLLTKEPSDGVRSLCALGGGGLFVIR